MNKWKLTLAVFSLLLLLGAKTPVSLNHENAVEDISALEAHALMQENLDNPDFIIVDVRTPEEYATGHLKGAVNINLNSGTFEEDIAKLDRSQTYLVYCRSGNRSSRAVSLMQSLEFAHIYHMAKGIIEWNAEGLPLEKIKEDSLLRDLLNAAIHKEKLKKAPCLEISSIFESA